MKTELSEVEKLRMENKKLQEQIHSLQEIVKPYQGHLENVIERKLISSLKRADERTSTH